MTLWPAYTFNEQGSDQKSASGGAWFIKQTYNRHKISEAETEADMGILIQNFLLALDSVHSTPFTGRPFHFQIHIQEEREAHRVQHLI